MHNKKPLVSICIPTYKRPQILRMTIDSILSEEISDKLLDICITDDSETDETNEVIDKYFSKVPNLSYKRTKCKDYLNIIEALKFGNGYFLKLHNDYSRFKKGELPKLVDIIKNTDMNNSVLFFSMGSLGKDIHIVKENNLDSFLYRIKIGSTWATSFGIWKSDFDEVLNRQPVISTMFPHTSILYKLHYKKCFIIDNGSYVENIPLESKGGYNLPNTFVNGHLEMLKKLKDMDIISKKTYNKIEYETLKFTALWYNDTYYHPEILKFSFEDKDSIIRGTCGEKMFFLYKLWEIIYGIKFKEKMIRHRIKSMWR